MLRKLIENMNSRRKSNGEVSPTKDKSITVNVRSLAFNTAGRRTIDCDDEEEEELSSPRSVHFHDDYHSSDSNVKTNRISLHLCKNCSSKYYCAYEIQSSVEFCSKDCKACYSFLTGRKL
mmetsp:Transcript_2887/g.5212  ORF Transcript_2887/g.5212 Transcript_2887/m.5212 type:complete len:120 (+) Transcript_2887:77-436(+)